MGFKKYVFGVIFPDRIEIHHATSNRHAHNIRSDLLKGLPKDQPRPMVTQIVNMRKTKELPIIFTGGYPLKHKVKIFSGDKDG